MSARVSPPPGASQAVVWDTAVEASGPSGAVEVGSLSAYSYCHATVMLNFALAAGPPERVLEQAGLIVTGDVVELAGGFDRVEAGPAETEWRWTADAVLAISGTLTIAVGAQSSDAAGNARAIGALIIRPLGRTTLFET